MAGPSEEIVPSGATEVPGVAETQVSNDCPKEMDDDFNADEEPGPLAEANVNDNKGNLAELEDSGHESFDESDPDEPEEEAVDNELSLPSRERAVKVKFSGMEGPSPPPEVNLETISRSQLIAKLGGLQERLTQTQVDLKQEKSNRRKKEKNIFKMAKELSKRQVEASEKDETIQKVCLYALEPLVSVAPRKSFTRDSDQISHFYHYSLLLLLVESIVGRHGSQT